MKKYFLCREMLFLVIMMSISLQLLKMEECMFMKMKYQILKRNKTSMIMLVRKW